MPFYRRAYSPGELPFITTRPFRRTPLFLSGRFRRCFAQRLDEVRQKLDSTHNNPGFSNPPPFGEWTD